MRAAGCLRDSFEMSRLSFQGRRKFMFPADQIRKRRELFEGCKPRRTGSVGGPCWSSRGSRYKADNPPAGGRCAKLGSRRPRVSQPHSRKRQPRPLFFPKANAFDRFRFEVKLHKPSSRVPKLPCLSGYTDRGAGSNGSTKCHLSTSLPTCRTHTARHRSSLPPSPARPACRVRTIS